MANVIDRFKATIANMVMRWSSQSSWFTWYPDSTTDYRREVGDGRGNSIVMACVNWVQRVFPEAPIQVIDIRGEQPEVIKNHEFVQLVNLPNQFYSGELLWTATLADWMIAGNAYWIILRSADDKPVELWWVPSSMIEPKWPTDGSEFITHYEYKPGREAMDVAVRDVVHFRNGIDPNNVRKGLSPLGALIREIYVDQEAGRFTAALLKNLGVPGVVIIPEEGTTINQPTADAVKASFSQKFGGDRRGEPLVMSSKVKVETLGFSPDDMNYDKIHRLPEERVSAIFGTPAVVVGLGAGLDRSTFENFSEAREAAYESNIIPTQRLFAAELKRQLLPFFVVEPADFNVGFDLTQVRILQPDQDAIYRRTERALKGGWVSMNEARIRTGYKPLETGNLYFLPPNAVIVEESLLTSILPASALPAHDVLNPDNNPGDQETGDGIGAPAIIMPKGHFPSARRTYIIKEAPALSPNIEPVAPGTNGNGRHHD